MFLSISSVYNNNK